MHSHTAPQTGELNSRNQLNTALNRGLKRFVITRQSVVIGQRQSGHTTIFSAFDYYSRV